MADRTKIPETLSSQLYGNMKRDDFSSSWGCFKNKSVMKDGKRNYRMQIKGRELQEWKPVEAKT